MELDLLGTLALWIIAVGGICSIAMIYSGVIGMLGLDLDKLSIRELLLRLLDLKLTGGAMWLHDSIRKNWQARDYERRTIYTGLIVGLINAGFVLIVVVIIRFKHSS